MARRDRPLRVRLGEAFETVTQTEYQVLCDHGFYPQCAASGDAGFHVEQHPGNEWMLTDRLVHLRACWRPV